MIVNKEGDKEGPPGASSAPTQKVGGEGRLDGPAARGPGVCLDIAGRRLELTQQSNRKRVAASAQTESGDGD
jgi:hypothetical protein